MIRQTTKSSRSPRILEIITAKKWIYTLPFNNNNNNKTISSDCKQDYKSQEALVTGKILKYKQQLRIIFFHKLIRENGKPWRRISRETSEAYSDWIIISESIALSFFQPTRLLLWATNLQPSFTLAPTFFNFPCLISYNRLVAYRTSPCLKSKNQNFTISQWCNCK